MSFAERAARRLPRRAGDAPLALGIFVALYASLMPLMRVVTPGAWVAGAMVLAGSVLTIGVIGRRSHLPGVAASLVEAVFAVAFLTAVFVGGTALLLVVPTGATFSAARALIETAMQEIQTGAAPLAPSAAIGFLIAGAVGVLAIVLDHVVLTARLPLVAAVGLIAISLIPAIVVPGEVDVAAFVLLAAAILFLVGVETRTRGATGEPASERVAGARATPGTPATALAIGAIAVVVAVVVTPLLPQPDARAVSAGIGQTGVTINPTLRLGEDLRRPNSIEVLRVRSTAPVTPYLRAATLSQFTGRVWVADRDDTSPLGSGAGFGAVTADPGIEVTEYSTHVEITALQSQLLPVPFPAVSINGLTSDWSAMPANRTVVGEQSSSSGLAYDVLTDVPRPTLEQIRARSAVGAATDAVTSELPDNTPAIIRQTAVEVTAGQTTDFDKLAAMQQWFRGSDFTYSLTAPVEQGFDGTGVTAVARFLEVKEGYCVHFAGAFALMARTLGMSARVVVGYLPGTNTNSSQEGETVFSVSSSQLHAWPEVYFTGIGWVAFEPTKSLGTATTFSSSTVTSTDPLDQARATTAPEEQAADTPTPTSTSAAGPTEDTAATTTSSASPLPWGLAAIGLVVALGIPALVREIRRRQLLAAAQAGDARAAWTSIQDIALDLGIAVPASESPRSLGLRLVAQHGAPADEMTTLTDAIERASYAEGRRHAFWHEGQELADAATAVRAGMLSFVDGAARLRALALPRSLVVRPGSVYADAARGERA